MKAVLVKWSVRYIPALMAAMSFLDLTQLRAVLGFSWVSLALMRQKSYCSGSILRMVILESPAMDFTGELNSASSRPLSTSFHFVGEGCGSRGTDDPQDRKMQMEKVIKVFTALV